LYRKINQRRGKEWNRHMPVVFTISTCWIW
jgi:hypothetical protein